ncbi:MAG: hypothetical protein KDI24_13155 [Pseudomonadales bacterium]|nr:hypothetical protein [Pseudomonadales bacterium]MCP5171301.1 hypothetical protein [Pseudomonadales bacterium]
MQLPFIFSNKQIIYGAFGFLALIILPQIVFSSNDSVIRADLPILEDVYKDVHAKRKDYEIYGFYPGMSRQEVLDQAQNIADEEIKYIRPQSDAPLEFYIEKGRIQIKTKFSTSAAHKKILRHREQKENDSVTFATWIQIEELYEDGKLNSEKILKRAREKFGAPIAETQSDKFHALEYRMDDAIYEVARRQCIAEVIEKNEDRAYGYGAEFGRKVAHIKAEPLAEAMKMCPNSVPALRRAMISEMSPRLEVRVIAPRNRVIYTMSYEAGKTFQYRNAIKDLAKIKE